LKWKNVCSKSGRGIGLKQDGEQAAEWQTLAEEYDAFSATAAAEDEEERRFLLQVDQVVHIEGVTDDDDDDEDDDEDEEYNEWLSLTNSELQTGA
jgi:hypothetical protein